MWAPDSGFLQLAHPFDSGEMVGGDDGTRSGLDGSMVRPLAVEIRRPERARGLKPADTVLDIGPDDVALVPGFCSAARLSIDDRAG